MTRACANSRIQEGDSPVRTCYLLYDSSVENGCGWSRSREWISDDAPTRSGKIREIEHVDRRHDHSVSLWERVRSLRWI